MKHIAKHFVGLALLLLSSPAWAIRPFAVVPPPDGPRPQSSTTEVAASEPADSNEGLYALVEMGVRGALTSTSGVPRGDGRLSVDFSFVVDALRARGASTTRLTQSAAIGGGTTGFDGYYLGSLTWGVRTEFAPGQGPFARAGFGWQLAGNDRYYASYFEVPKVEIGYQLVHTDIAFELGARGGAILVGDVHIEGDHRNLGTNLEVGGFALLGTHALHFTGEVFRADATSLPGRALDVVRGHGCFAWFAALCADATYYRTEVDLTTAPHHATASYVGISLGFGLAGEPESLAR